MRPFGCTTLTFVAVTEDLNNRDRLNKPAIIRTETSVPGCRFRPLPATETAREGAQVVKDHWRATCPPVAAVLAAKSRDEIKVDGVTLQIVGGPRVSDDLAGRPVQGDGHLRAGGRLRGRPGINYRDGPLTRTATRRAQASPCRRSWRRRRRATPTCRWSTPSVPPTAG